MVHYLARLQNATKKYWDKSALNTIDGESFTYGQMATQVEKFHLFLTRSALRKAIISPFAPGTGLGGA